MTETHQQHTPNPTDTTIRATIPIDLQSGVYLNEKHAHAFGETLAKAYRTATPFPHIAIDDFLPIALATEILKNFPTESADKKAEEHALNYTGIQVNKRQVYPNDTNAFCRNIFGFFNSAAFLQFLEGMTGLTGLIADPYFHGGGFHETSRGGKLGVHADFRVHEQLHLQRRLNVLIYLNQNWPEDFGGTLEIWDPSMTKKCHSILPLFNRCVVFSTDAKSYHGHPEPLTCPPDRTRKSIALYYYTASKAVYEEVPSASTMYVSRPGEDAHSQRMARKLRLQNYAKDFLPPVLFRALRALKKKI